MQRCLSGFVIYVSMDMPIWRSLEVTLSNWPVGQNSSCVPVCCYGHKVE